MRRGLHIVVSLMAVVLLIRPFDCFVATTATPSTMDCCLKGNCAPSAKSDECCKASVPDGSQLVMSKAADHSMPLVIVAHVSSPGSFWASTDLVVTLRHPPPLSDLAGRNLPLLI